MAILTCAFTLPVKLELVPGLALTILITYLHRFMSRRGIPETFISDNAKIFNAKDLKIFLGDYKI